ncbi:MAG: beta-propeller fold lactonase family protein [Burkholderiales bacterium]
MTAPRRPHRTAPARTPLLAAAIAALLVLGACGDPGAPASSAPATPSATAPDAASGTGWLGMPASLDSDTGAPPQGPALATKAALTAGTSTPSFASFEAPHVHPLELTPDGKRLLAVNTAAGTLEIFDVAADRVSRSTVVNVGMDPVSVRVASNTEAWVVNHLSDTISVVDLDRGTVVNTIATDDEPADVVFAGSPRRAWVSCAQARTLMVIDPANTAASPVRVPILGQQPRALAVSRDGKTVYLGIFESGNGTTALSAKDSGFEPNIVRDPDGPYGGVNPPPNANDATTFDPPLNAANGAPPSGVSLIVRRTPAGDWLDDNGRSWKKWVTGGPGVVGSRGRSRVAGWDLVDRDLAIVDTASRSVSYAGGMLNIVMALAVNPASGAVSVVGTDALNHVRYEPKLNGRFLRVQMGRVAADGSTATRDLNLHLDYTTSSVPKTVRDRSLGDPRGIAWNAAGTRALVTGMGSNNVVVVDADGRRVGTSPIEVGQGPTGVVMQESSGRAFVLNRFDASISVIDLARGQVSRTVGLSHDPTPDAIRAGRPLLYDTHRTSGLGHVSCASCHVDGKTDRLAWDLGNPAGEMLVTTDAAGRTVRHHPMKGPLLTQTLVDTMQSALLHWRGDKPDLGHFAGAFKSLQGTDAPATDAEIAALRSFLVTLRTPPNPYRTLENGYSNRVEVPGPRGETLRVGDAEAGAQEFERGCRGCHPGNTGRGAVFHSDRPQFSGTGIVLTAPRWQNFYKRDGLWFGDATGSSAGFGFQQDGTYDSTHNGSRTNNMMAFMYSFNGSFPYEPRGLNATNAAVDAHAAVGRQVAITSGTAASPVLDTLLSLADRKAVGLVAHTCVAGQRKGYAYVGGGTFWTDRRYETETLLALRQRATPASPVVFTAVLAGSEARLGMDQDADGTHDSARGRTVDRACGNLLANGSFEDNPLQPGAWRIVDGLPGWTSPFGLEVWRSYAGNAAAQGDSFVELDAAGGLDAISQTVATRPGEALTLRFAYAARPGVRADSTAFVVRWNGREVARLSPDGTGATSVRWLSHTVDVVATGRDTLSFEEAGVNDSYGALLDRVELYRR